MADLYISQIDYQDKVRIVHDLQSKLSKAEEEIIKWSAKCGDLEMQLADRKQKYEIAMDKGVDVLAYKLKKAEELIGKLEIVVKKSNDDFWFISNLLEKYSTNKEEAIKDVIHRTKFRKPMFDSALEEIAKWRGE